jgi:outer membrane protein assembly factor BamB
MFEIHGIRPFFPRLDKVIEYNPITCNSNIRQALEIAPDRSIFLALEVKMRTILAVIFMSLVLLTSCAGDSQAQDDVSTSGSEIVLTLESPGSEISGLAWGDGSLWAVDAATSTIFRLDDSTGDVIDSFQVDHPSYLTATGLAYSDEHQSLVLGLWDVGTNGYVYILTPEGENKGSSSMCGG